MSWEDVLVQVIDGLAKVVITVGIPYLFYLIRQKVNNDILTSLVEDAEKAVSDCVLTINQTYVDALKAEDKFDAEAAEEAFYRCVNAVSVVLSDAAKDAIVRTVGDFDKWLEVQIESNVKLYKE